MTGNLRLLDVEIDMSGLKRKFAGGTDALVFGVRRAVVNAAREGLDESKRTKRYRDRSGNLSGKAHVTLPIFVGKSVSCEIRWPSKYASFVDGGTAPHPIEARRAPALVFWWPKIGALFIGKRVNHPGTRATGFAGVAYHKAERVLERDVEVAVAEARGILER